jgi:putative DNA primase/helicase
MSAVTKRRKRANVHAGSIGDPESLDLREQSGRTDTANGKRLAQGWGDQFRWCEPWKKAIVWDGKRWAQDNELKLPSYAKLICENIWRDTGKLLPAVGGELATEMVRFAKNTASAKGIDNMLKMARSEKDIPVLPEQLDSHPWYFNCANGVIDLQTGKLLGHRKEFLLTKLSPIEYPTDSGVDCPLWLDTLEKIFAGDSEIVGFVRRLLGSAMVGSVTEHILPIFWGSGSNGKSLVVETLLEIFGEYGDKAAADLLMTKRNESHPTERADLHGRRLVFCVETEDGRRLAESMVKELTGGDTIKARRMREDFWSFIPSHSAILATNHRPRVRGSDHAMWRRLRLVPFTVTFWDETRGETGPPELKADRQLKEKLRAEHPGILRWLVNGCLEWQRIGLGEPDAVRAATADYKQAEDIIAQFFNECCAWPVEGVRTSFADLRAEYELWCKRNGEKPFSSRRLGDWLFDHGVEKKRSNGIQYEQLGIVGTVEGSNAFSG